MVMVTHNYTSMECHVAPEWTGRAVLLYVNMLQMPTTESDLWRHARYSDQ